MNRNPFEELKKKMEERKKKNKKAKMHREIK